MSRRYNVLIPLDDFGRVSVVLENALAKDIEEVIGINRRYVPRRAYRYALGQGMTIKSPRTNQRYIIEYAD